MYGLSYEREGSTELGSITFLIPHRIKHMVPLVAEGTCPMTGRSEVQAATQKGSTLTQMPLSSSE